LSDYNVQVDLSTEFSGIKLQTVLINASGAKDVTLAELQTLGESRSSAIVIKSATIEKRIGNHEPRYYSNNLGSINSSGLPNLGFEEYCRFLPQLKGYGKPVVASVAGFTAQEYAQICIAFKNAGADAIELNLSCPNLEGKPQAGYDFDYSRQVLELVRPLVKIPLGAKLPPYLEIAHQQEMAKILLEYKIDFATLVNSVGNAMIVDAATESAVIRPKKGLGGLGGAYIKPVALGNVWSFYNLLEGKVSIKGCGGVYTGIDAFEHLLCGADAVALGTVYYEQGPEAFSRIEKELALVLEEHGYKSARDAVGKLKTL
jgi:dihydroorotate dehydrogenase (fumarate)